jgi:hypothetical protein
VSLRLISAACSRTRARERRRPRGVSGVACFLTESARSGGFHAGRLRRFAGLPPERIDDTIEEFREQQLPELEGQARFKRVLVMLNRGIGQAAALTFWENEADLHASEKVASRAREAAVASAQPAREPIVDRYEVVLQR